MGKYWFLKHSDEDGDWFLSNRGCWDDSFEDHKRFGSEEAAEKEAAKREAILRNYAGWEFVKVRAIPVRPI